MRVLLWWPGASVSVSDVAAGLDHGLRAAGADVHIYRTDVHLEAAATYLKHLWRERGKQPHERPTLADICYQASAGVLERALRVRADWVITVSGLYQHPDMLLLLRRAGLKVGFLCTESPYDLGAELGVSRYVDHVWTNERSTLPIFRTVARSASYLRHAWHPGVHGAAAVGGDTAADVPAHDVVFVGTGFIERIKVLEAVNWDGIDFGLYGHWSLLGSRSRLRPFLREGAIPNTRTAALYRRAAIGLNLHRTSTRYGRQPRHVVRAESLNPRAYELAACGCFFVSDWRAEVDNVFRGELDTFRTPAALEAQLRAWLGASREVREARAAQLRQAVARETWERRAVQVIADLERCEEIRRAA